MARAKKSTTRRLSRREMVTLLGSGVVLLRSGGVEVEAQGGPCLPVKPIKGTLTASSPGVAPVTRSVLVGDPCCEEGLDAFFNGFNNMKSTGKGHLKEFAAALEGSKAELLEYCVMVWGLTKADSVSLASKLREQYRMKEYTAPAPAKK